MTVSRSSMLRIFFRVVPGYLLACLSVGLFFAVIAGMSSSIKAWQLSPGDVLESISISFILGCVLLALPTLFLVVIVEWMGRKSVAFHITFASILMFVSCALFIFFNGSLLWGEVDPFMKTGVLSNFLQAGLVPWVLFIGGAVCAGVVYWGIAGRTAGAHDV